MQRAIERGVTQREKVQLQPTNTFIEAGGDNDKKLVVILIGGNGIGKGTVAKETKKRNPNRRIGIATSGDAVRGSKNPNDPDFGKFHEDLAPYLNKSDKGKRIPDSKMNHVTRQQLADAFADGNDIVFADGGIRTQQQLEFFKKVTMPQLQQDIDVDYIGIHIAGDEETSQLRSKIRALTAKENKQPVRKDDEPEVVKSRYKDHERKSPAVLRSLAAEGKLVTMSGQPTGRDVITNQFENIVFSHYDRINGTLDLSDSLPTETAIERGKDHQPVYEYVPRQRNS